MTVTHAQLSRYIGGQILIEDFGNRLLHRGEIRSFTFGEDELLIGFNWLARARGFSFQGKKRWKLDAGTGHTLADITGYQVIGIDPGNSGGDNRLALLSSAASMTAIFFPANGDKLDPLQVKGFKPEARIIL